MITAAQVRAAIDAFTAAENTHPMSEAWHARRIIMQDAIQQYADENNLTRAEAVKEIESAK